MDTPALSNSPNNHILAAGPVLVTRPVHPVVAAQRAGDAAYELCLERGLGGEAAALAYHMAYQDVARATGCGPICRCPMCEPSDALFGVENPACSELER